MEIDTYLILFIALVAIVSLILLPRNREGYRSFNDDMHNYYHWKPYSDNVYDRKKLMSFPYDYYPYEYNQKFNRYYPSDVDFGTYQ